MQIKCKNLVSLLLLPQEYLLVVQGKLYALLVILILQSQLQNSFRLGITYYLKETKRSS